jgi:hypothetical protein
LHAAEADVAVEGEAGAQVAAEAPRVPAVGFLPRQEPRARQQPHAHPVQARGRAQALVKRRLHGQRAQALGQAQEAARPLPLNRQVLAQPPQKVGPAQLPAHRPKGAQPRLAEKQRTSLLGAAQRRVN